MYHVVGQTDKLILSAEQTVTLAKITVIQTAAVAYVEHDLDLVHNTVQPFCQMSVQLH